MFSTVESGYFKNGASYFINGGLQDKSLDDVISIIQHESVHYQIFHCSSLGMYLLMCEKISKVDYSRDDILLELRRYYKRMQEELATYIEMVRYLLQHGYEKFIEEVNRMKYDNKEYYSYFKKISCRNDKLGILKLKTYEPEKLVSLIRCLLRVGIDAFNIEIGVLKFEEIQSPIDLQRKMSNERFLFNPNRRYKELVKTIMFKDGEFQYNNQSISVAPLDTYTIQEYIEMVQRNYPENKVVQSRLKSFKITEFENYPIEAPDLSNSFPFLDIKGKTYNFTIPEIGDFDKFDEYFENDDIKIKDIYVYPDGHQFCFIVRLLGGREVLYQLFDYIKGESYRIVLQLAFKHRCVIRFFNFYIFNYPNWKTLVNVLPKETYIFIPASFSSSVNNIFKFLNGWEFKILEMNGYDVLAFKNEKLVVLQPIIRQFSIILKEFLQKDNNNKLVNQLENEDEIREQIIEMMEGVLLAQNVDSKNLIEGIRKKFKI